jgi:predicted dehydrogenase
MPDTSKLRIGILSTAKIAGEFMRGVKPSSKIAVPAVASRDAARAKRFAREHGIAKAYDSYEALLADPDVQAVYNPLPNALHAAWSIKALEAGKHVLCEKPLGVSADEAREMFDAAGKAGRHLAEAYPYLAQPLTTKLRQMLSAGDVGRIESLQASFGFPMPSSANIRLDAALGGGALLDAGCYPISLVRVIAAECPVRVQAASSWVSPGVDKTTSATFEFASGMLAQISCSFGTAVHRFALIAGSRGIIETNYFNSPPSDRPATMQIRRGTSWEAAHRPESVEAPAVNGFLAEAESFCDLIDGGTRRWSGATPVESIDISRMIDAIKRSVRTGNSEQVRS